MRFLCLVPLLASLVLSACNGGLNTMPNHVTVGACSRQQFVPLTTNPALGRGAVWLVNGVVGGNAAVGVVSSAGVYTPPSVSVPTRFTVQALLPNTQNLVFSGVVTVNPLSPEYATLSGGVASVGATVGVAKMQSAASGASSTNEVLLRVRGVLPPHLNGFVLQRALALPNTGLYRLGRVVTANDLQALENVPGVVYAAPNSVLGGQGLTQDVLSYCQWALQPSTSDVTGGIRLPEAWPLPVGGASTVVGVLDTGVLWRGDAAKETHPELVGRVLPGFDFVSSVARAKDGDGRDSDAFDAADPGVHGSHIAGIVAANVNNQVGVAGINGQAKILPLRVLGENETGDLADVVDAMLWSAGFAVAGAPQNPNRASVLNLSLNGPGFCSRALQDAINAVVAQGVTVVVAAGNASTFAGLGTVSGCSNVVVVGASDIFGFRASYSNLGRQLDVLAPGGRLGQRLYAGGPSAGILGLGLEGGAPGYQYVQGTSVAAPHVTGVVSLMQALRPGITPGEVRDVLHRSARPIGDEACNLGNPNLGALDCGAGLLDARRALELTGAATPGYDLEVQGKYISLALETTRSTSWRVSRFGGFADAVVVSVGALPVGVTASVDQVNATVQFVAAANAPLGVYEVALEGAAAGQPVRRSSVMLEIN